MMRKLGCLVIPIVLIIFWGIVAYLITHPPGDEDIPWLIAGPIILIILGRYFAINEEN